MEEVDGTNFNRGPRPKAKDFATVPWRARVFARFSCARRVDALRSTEVRTRSEVSVLESIGVETASSAAPPVHLVRIFEKGAKQRIACFQMLQ